MCLRKVEGGLSVPLTKVGEYGREPVGGDMQLKTEAFSGMVDGLAHGEDKVWE